MIVYTEAEMVMENASAQIMVKNISLKSMTKYFVRVKVWAGKEESCWAETFFCYRYPEYSGMEGFIYYCRE